MGDTAITLRQLNWFMRGVSVVLLLFMSSLLPIAAAVDLPIAEGLGAPLSDDAEQAPLTYSYSPAIRAAFARASDISQYSDTELESATQWVAVSSQPLGKESNLLADAWIIDIDSTIAPTYFADLQAKGIVETAYPLVYREIAPKAPPKPT